jgi:hypothetical protein
MATLSNLPSKSGSPMAGKSAEGSGTTVLFIAPGQTVQPKTKAYLPSTDYYYGYDRNSVVSLTSPLGGLSPCQGPSRAGSSHSFHRPNHWAAGAGREFGQWKS